MLRRVSVLSILGASVVLLLAQQPAQQTSQQTTPQPPAATPSPSEDLTKTQRPADFSMTLQNVTAPVLVRDRRGNIINGLQPDQFRLFDNGKEQNLASVDVTYTPMSMVVAVQANALSDKILPQVNTIGAMLKPVLLGDAGQAAVMAYDSRVRLIQPFTSDADDITKAIKGIHAGSTPARALDALEEATMMLNHVDKNRRRIIMMIGEGRDNGSEAKTRETLRNLQLANITVYWIDMSHFIGKITEAAPDPRPDPMPPAMHPMPPGVPATPTTVDQVYGTNGGSADFVPLLVEVFKDVKKIFNVPTATLYSKGTGGEQFSFATRRGLEEAITKISNDLHSQYLITYRPNNMEDGGFHKIEVMVVDHEYRCDTKPGYWMSPKFQ